ncbi:MAG TPA: ABC transporter substrate-binding protein [Gaiellaceae bacterium]|jgi:peptide/nickel transport system substrate-binding protein
MKARSLGMFTAMALAVAVLAGGCGGGSSSSSGTSSEGGVLRIGTINYIDSFNPLKYIEAQSTNAFIMIYPQLVQYRFGKQDGYQIEGDWAKSWDTSSDGKDWTFHLRPNTKWSDGKPLTADDAAWTINTVVKFANGPTAVAAASLAHVKNAEAPDPTTLVIHYASPVGNVLAQLETFSVLPRHVYEPLAAGNGKGLETFHPEQHMPIVSAGAYRIKQYEKKGTTVFIRDPNYWGPPSHAAAVALTYYTNADAMIADLKGGQLDWVDQVPFNAVDVLKKDSNIVVNTVPGAETTNITWNSNPRKQVNRELLDPRVKKALSMCVDRERIIDVVFSGYADTVESLVGHISPLENPNLGPLQYDCDAGNQMLDDLGYKKGPDGIRTVPATTGKYAQPAHKMTYDLMTPTSTDFNVNREFGIVQQGFAQAGVKVTQHVGGDATASYAYETGDNCDASKSTGYEKFDFALWDWVGYVDPDFQLSVVTKGQWCSWSDTGWDNPAYDKLYDEQGTTVDPEKRKEIVYEMQQMIYDNFLYTQLINEQTIDAHTKAWTGIQTELSAYSKAYYTSPQRTG